MHASMHRCLFLVGTLMILAGCQSGNGNSPSSGDRATTPAPETASIESDHAVATAAAALALDPEGLRLVDPSSGSTHVLTFGMDQEKVLTAVSSLRGNPVEKGVQSECGAGPLAFASWADGLNLSFSERSFSGWGVNGNAPGAERHTTVAGIGIGSTRAELEEAYDIRTGETSLGTEFAAGELHGVLRASGSNAEITSLWSGTTCVFR